jgi:hypothetical protein
MGTYIGLAIIAAIFFAYKQRAVLPKVDPSYIVLGIAAVAFVAYQESDRWKVITPPAPIAATQTDHVAAVAKTISGDDAKEFGNFCLALAEQLEADAAGEYFKSVEDFKSVNAIAGKGSLKKRLKHSDGVTPKYPGFADAFDAAVAEATGGRDTFLSSEQRAKLVTLLRGLHAALT